MCSVLSHAQCCHDAQEMYLEGGKGVERGGKRGVRRYEREEKRGNGKEWRGRKEGLWGEREYEHDIQKEEMNNKCMRGHSTAWHCTVE